MYEIKTEIESYKKLGEFIKLWLKWRKKFRWETKKRFKELVKMNRYELWKTLT